MTDVPVEIDRRKFLAGLAAAGLAPALPDGLETAPEADVSQQWLVQNETPIVFEVEDYGAIASPNVKEPKCNRDIFDDVTTSYIKTIEDIIYEIESCYALREHFRWLAYRRQDELGSELDELDHQLQSLEAEGNERPVEDMLALSERRDRVQLQLEQFDNFNEDDNWKALITGEGEANVQTFVKEIEKWLAEEPDWNLLQDLNDDWWSPRGDAKKFFADLPNDIRRALGVIIVEGDRPGSTYFAAELEKPIEETNRLAEVMNIPIRFRKAAPENG